MQKMCSAAFINSNVNELFAMLLELPPVDT